MPSTPINALPSPDENSTNQPYVHISALASQLDSRLLPRFTTTTARDSAITAPVNGMSCWVDSPGAFYDRLGGAWVRRGQADYAKASNPSDLTQVANVWCTVPVTNLATEGRSGIYTVVQRNNIAYTAHPARSVVRFESGGQFRVEGQQFTDSVGVQLRLARNIDTALEALAVSPSAVSSGAASVSTTRRFATGDVVALQGFYTAAYIVRADGTQLGTAPNVYTVNTHLTITRVGD